jgi:uncharacterized membrane-anchored protein YjiN (DUF445 family)
VHNIEKTKIQRQRERELIAKYYDRRMREILEPLYAEFQRWKKGEISHDELSDAIHRCHKENQKLYRLFTSSREFILKTIEFEKKWREMYGS